MDDTRRLAILRKQVDEARGGQPDNLEAWRQRSDAALRTAMGPTHPTVERFNDVSYSVGVYYSGMPEHLEDDARRDGVQTGIAILQGAIAEIEMRSPEAPTATPADFHPWIAGAVAGLWDSGHHRQAVDEATRAIELRLKMKVDSHQTGAPLVTDAFSTSPPRVGQRRLRFPQFREGTPSWTNAHEGAMSFGRGCAMRIRNLLEHEEDDIDHQVAVECLAALSLLARWIDEATVISEGD